MENGKNESRPSTRRERERQRYRADIMEAASVMFGRQGYEKTSMQQIADYAEVSVGKLYSHFEGKEAIFREVVAFHSRSIRERCDRACRPEMKPLDQIRCRMRAALEYCHRHRDFIRFYSSEDPPAMKSIEAQVHRNYKEITARLLERAMVNGDIPREDPSLLAAMIEGAARYLFEAFPQADEESLEKIFDLMDKIIFRPLEERGNKL
ncbi:MAG: TetR/AcrR family transcriptional regulator [Candidatus Krumholzibacteriota bacterium]|nr:TetR/AcrR family transcriptional regulator [Candidatus Krumholzibacteriota bacterium]